MISFYIDTSSSFLYTALVKDNELLSYRNLSLNHDLSTFTIDEVSKMFNSVNLEPKDVDQIIVCNGPGSFTGIRIGVTIAKVMALSLKKKIIPISSLLVMALSCDNNTLKVPIINARRNCVYGGIYNGIDAVLPDEYMSIEKLILILKGLNREYTFISNDTFNDLVTCKYEPNYLKVVDYCKNEEELNPHMINPVYLKLTEAEENRMKDEQ